MKGFPRSSISNSLKIFKDIGPEKFSDLSRETQFVCDRIRKTVHFALSQVGHQKGLLTNISRLKQLKFPALRHPISFIRLSVDCLYQRVNNINKKNR